MSGKARVRRVEELSVLILSMAARDLFSGVGRVLVPELEAQGFSYDEIVEALNKLREEGYTIGVVGDVIKVYFEPREGARAPSR
jgi:hypothetical protein